MCTLPPDQPDPAAHAYSRGTAAIYLGETEEALRQLDTAIRLQPTFGPAWMSLSRAADFTRETSLVDRLLAAEEAVASAPPEHRAPYWFARGKLHAERGEHDNAFAACARGGEEMKALAPYDPEKDRKGAQESIRSFSPERIAAIAGEQREPTDRSIFVTGLPRSGTTLVEQILASHSAVNDGGEVNRLFLLACEVGGDSYDALARYVGEHGTAKAAKLWHHWLQERFPTPGRVVDKSINTTRFIGLAAALLPDAPLIWLTRDPLDRAWSCFSTFFTTGMEWSYDLEDIARHFRLEDELLRQWQAILGQRLLVVPYEELVCEPETWTRRILAHCGLCEEPQVFTPHLTDRAVTTASTMQVRRPINRRAIGSAEPYRQFLEPFIRAYNG
jgi:tetratricopeptide (TPR) repeat protein